MPSARANTLWGAAVSAFIATVLVAGTGIALIEFGIVDDSPLINRAIPVLGGAMGLIAFLWRYEQADN